MSDPNVSRRHRRVGMLRGFVSIVLAAAILLLALSTILASPDWLDRAVEMLPAEPPAPAASATEAAPSAPPAEESGAPGEAAAAVPTSAVFDLKALQNEMLGLINADRAAAGLAPVAWDETAARAAQAHALDMARHGYLSHRDRQGHGPFYRYSQAGGLDSVHENVYLFWQRYDGGGAAPIDDWSAVVRNAQEQLMGSPGHRDNILAPAHTHVGIGIAYNENTGDVRLAQLFSDDYVDLESVPLELSISDELRIAGTLHPGVSQPLLNLAHEPWSKPMTVEELNQTGSFTSEAQVYEALPLPVREGTFERTVHIGHEGRPGLYHLRVWVETAHGTTLAVNVVIRVR